MLINIQTNKNHFSTWILGFFIMTLVVAGFSSEFFQAPVETTRQYNKLRSLFKPEELNKVESFNLSNRLGEYLLSKNNFYIGETKEGMPEKVLDPDNPWNITLPRELPANNKTISKIITELKQIKIRKIFQKDAISISNFSLNTPLLTLELIHKNSSQKIFFGLVNPIDNSTYIMFENKEAIYHVDALTAKLETLDLADFVDSKIISVPSSKITSIEIYRGEIKKNNVKLFLNKTDGNWLDNKGKSLEPTKVDTFVSSLSSLRSILIIDKKTEKLQKQLKKYLTNPFYTLKIKDSTNKIFTYKISTIINSLDEIKMEKRQNFVISASNRQHPYLVKKNFFKLFSKAQNSFKTLSIKKLFY